MGAQISSADQTVKNTVKAIVDNTNKTISKSKVSNFQSQLISISDVDYLKFANSKIEQNMTTSVNLNSLFQIQSQIDTQQALKNDLEFTAKSANSGLALFSTENSQTDQNISNFVSNTMNNLNEVRNTCMENNTGEQDIIINNVSYMDIENGSITQEAAAKVYEKCVVNSNEVLKASQVTDNKIKADAASKNSGLSLNGLLIAAAILLAVIAVCFFSAYYLFEAFFLKLLIILVGVAFLIYSIPFYKAWYDRSHVSTTMNIYPFSMLLGKTRTDCGLTTKEVRTDVPDYGTAVSNCLNDKECKAVDFQAYVCTPKPGCVVSPVCLDSQNNTRPCDEGETPVKVTTYYNNISNSDCKPENDCKAVLKGGTRVYYSWELDGKPSEGDGDFSYKYLASQNQDIGDYGHMTLTREGDGTYTLASTTYDFRQNSKFFYAMNLSYSQFSINNKHVFSVISKPDNFSVKVRWEKDQSDDKSEPKEKYAYNDSDIVRTWPRMAGVPKPANIEIFSVYIELKTGDVWTFKDGDWVPVSITSGKGIYGSSQTTPKTLSDVRVGGGGANNPWSDYSAQKNPYRPGAPPLPSDPTDALPSISGDPSIKETYNFYVVAG